MKSTYKRDYPFAYNNLREEYERIKSVLINIEFQDEKLSSIKDQMLKYSMPEIKDMLTHLKETKDFIIPFLKEIQHANSLIDEVDEQKLSSEVLHIKLVNQLLYRFTSDLNRIIEDIKLQCIENDWVDSLLKLVDTDDINSLEDSGNTLLMRATSCKYPSIKIINKLLELGADPFTKCRFSETPFSKAINNDNWELAKKYLEHKITSLNQDELITSELKVLYKLCNELEVEKFYFDLAHDLFSSEITNILGLDPASTEICLLHIKENYEALGKDSDILYT